MSSIKVTGWVRSRLRDCGRIAVFSGALALGAACSHMPWNSSSAGTPMQASPRVPAAEGRVAVKDADNGNVKLAVDVKHLGSPEKIATGATSYVVWLKPLATAGNESEVPHNMGALAVNKDEEGTLDTMTSYRSFDIFVTAEPEPGSTSPTGEQLLSTTIRR